MYLTLVVSRGQRHSGPRGSATGRGTLKVHDISCVVKRLEYRTMRGQHLPTRHTIELKHVPASTWAPPLSSVGLISFQKTIRSCPSFTVLVTSTSPSSSSSSMAAGASFHDSFKARTEMPLPFRVCRWISVRRAALLRKLNSCCDSP